MKEKMMVFSQKVGTNRYLLSLRDSFLYASALTIVAGFILMINSVFLDPTAGGIIWGEGGLNIGALIYGSVDSFQASSLFTALQNLQAVLNLILLGTINIYAIMIVVALAKSLNTHFFKDNKEDDIMVILYAIGAYFISIPWFTMTDGVQNSSTLDLAYLGTTGIFTAIITTTIVVFLYNKIVKAGITIKMPKDVPSAVEKSFASMIPGTVVLMVFVVLKTVLYLISPAINSVLDTGATVTLPSLITVLLQAPMLAISQTWAFSIFLVGGIWFVFWFGIHGFAVFGPIMNSTWSILGMQNMAGTGHYIVTDLFYNYAVVTAGAVTLAPIIAIFIGSKKKGVKKIAKFALIPALFGISEPLLYGLPIVLNPYFLIPLVLAPLAQFFIAQFFTVIGIVPVAVNSVPWTTPIFFSGILYTNSIVGGLFQLVLLAVGILIWLPFVKLNDRLGNAE